jgi:hypothetical protein
MREDLFFNIIIVVGVLAVVLWKAYNSRRWREAMALLARRLGLQFDESKDYKLAERHQFLDKLAVGENPGFRTRDSTSPMKQRGTKSS